MATADHSPQNSSIRGAHCLPLFPPIRKSTVRLRVSTEKYHYRIFPRSVSPLVSIYPLKVRPVDPRAIVFFMQLHMVVAVF